MKKGVMRTKESFSLGGGGVGSKKNTQTQKITNKKTLIVTQDVSHIMDEIEGEM